ncbi:hypothetical protein VaNZ11_007420 [Volvox africanus]|uniref:Uncharacterized protein n=1 Tax=Volvox africanus TaxID=51714 RepID=A0ABQ5S4H2_9CHLO|nr:hypothetical protein VaNZ11_007420 [Volvox africanus]
MANSACKTFCHSPSSGPPSRCGETDFTEPDMANDTTGSSPNSCASVLKSTYDTDHANTCDFCNEKVSTDRRAMCFPGAWAIGEGVLLEMLEEGSVGCPAASEDHDGGPDIIRGGDFSSLAGNLTATMGLYLTSLASAITGGTLDASFMNGRNYYPCGGAVGNHGSTSRSSSSGMSTSSSSTRQWTTTFRPDAASSMTQTPIANKKDD